MVELLVVIVILGIIMLIATPLILNVINDARKGAFKNSVHGIVKATEIEHMQLNFSRPNIGDVIFTYVDGVETSNVNDLKLNYKGTPPESGSIIMRNDGEISLSLHNGKWCAEKGYNESTILITDKTKEECITNIDLPTIELIGSNPLYIEINTEYIDPGVIAKTNTGTIITNIETIIKSNSNIVENIEINKLGSYEIIYSARENNVYVEVTREVIIRDTIPPTLTIPASTTITIEEVNDFNYLEGVSVSDNSLEELVIKVSGNLSRLPGVYEITYSAEDSSGNIATKSRVITVIDTESPVIIIKGNNPVTINYGSTYVDEGATAFDNLDGDITSTIVVSGFVNTSVLGEHKITYTVKDSSNNTSTATRVVNVIDNVNPIITFGTNGNSAYAKIRSTTVTVSDAQSGVNTSSLKYIWTTTITDPSEASITSVFSNSGTISTPSGVSGSYYLWILAKDIAGNTIISRSNVFNLDNEAPVITSVTTSATNITENSFTITRSGNATDAHSGLAANPYIYQRSPDGTSWTTVCTNNTTSCNVTGLTANTNYHYRICVNDNLSNQSCTASKTMKTLEGNVGTITDSRDGKTYPWVKIGTQVWMAENLKYTGNGCLSKVWSSSTYDPHEACLANGAEIHYQWGAAMNGSTTPGAQGICPSGWHLPTDEEWKLLEGTVDSTYGIGNATWDEYGPRGTDAGKKLKATSGNGTNDYGFNGLLVGYRSAYDGGPLYGVGTSSSWWPSPSSSGSLVSSRSVNSVLNTVNRATNWSANGFSVRCVRD